MKKLSIMLFFSLSLSFLFISRVNALDGYICEGGDSASCRDCNPDTEEGCKRKPPKPVITNTEELKQKTNLSKIRIRGLGSADTQVVIFINGKEIHRASVSVDDTFDESFEPNIPDAATYKLEVALENTSTVQGQKSTPIMLDVDKKAPEVTLVNIPNFSSFEKILISGSTEPNLKVFIKKDDNTIYETGSDANGNFDAILELKDDTNKFVVEVMDEAGNKGNKDISIKLDRNSDNSLGIKEVDGPKIKLQVPEGIVRIDIVKNGYLISTIPAETSEVEIDLTQFISGRQNEFQFTGVDSAGNSTKAVVYDLSSTQPAMFFIGGIALFVILTILVVYLNAKGRLKLPFLRKLYKPQLDLPIEQDTLDDEIHFKDEDVTDPEEIQEDRESEDGEDGNITPDNLRKKF